MVSLQNVSSDDIPYAVQMLYDKNTCNRQIYNAYQASSYADMTWYVGVQDLVQQTMYHHNVDIEYLQENRQESLFSFQQHGLI